MTRYLYNNIRSNLITLMHLALFLATTTTIITLFVCVLAIQIIEGIHAKLGCRIRSSQLGKLCRLKL